ncbi:ester cyclase [Chloroflexi bacterium TSY]|nr:ester cyclase [Chloroflexi bacterium TSY]
MKQRIYLFITTITALALLVSACQPIMDIASAEATSVSTLEANKALIRRFVKEGKNRENPAAVREIFSPDYQHHFHMPGEEIPPGLAGPARIGEIFGTAFPEIEVTIEILIAEGDYVLERSNVTALNGGPFLNIPATNQTVTWTENHLYRIVDGLIVEHWPEADMAGLLEQVGALSAITGE